MTRSKTDQTLAQLNQLYRVLGQWQAVAAFTGYNRATINRWFNGRRRPSVEARQNVNFTVLLVVK